MTDVLEAAYEQYLVDSDEQTLLAAVDAACRQPPPEEMDTPHAHRIRDLRLRGEAFRVVRTVDPTTWKTRLYIYELPAGYSEIEGVPLRIRGAALRAWFEDELARLEREEEGDEVDPGQTDWSRYEGSAQSSCCTGCAVIAAECGVDGQRASEVSLVVPPNRDSLLVS